MNYLMIKIALFSGRFKTSRLQYLIYDIARDPEW